MATKAALGWQVTHTYCRACAPEGLRDCYPPLREGDDHGVPYRCDMCDEPLASCEHEWGAWHPWYAGGEFRACEHGNCDEIQRREGT